MKQVTIDTKKAGKLLLICRSLDKNITGLDGRKLNLLTMVRCGIEGLTFKELYARLGATK